MSEGMRRMVVFGWVALVCGLLIAGSAWWVVRGNYWVAALALVAVPARIVVGAKQLRIWRRAARG